MICEFDESNIQGSLKRKTHHILSRASLRRKFDIFFSVDTKKFAPEKQIFTQNLGAFFLSETRIFPYVEFHKYILVLTTVSTKY